MLRSALGVSEREFLKISNEGRAYFDEYMSSKFEKKEDYKNIIKSFIVSTEKIYNTEYNDRVINKMLKKDIFQNRKIAFEELINNSKYCMELRMNKEIQSIKPEEVETYLKKSKAELNILNSNFLHGIENFKIPYRDLEINKEQEYIIKGKIECIELINKAKNIMSEKDKKDVLKYISGNYDPKSIIDNVKDVYGEKLEELNNMPRKTLDISVFNSNLYREQGSNESWEDPNMEEYVRELFGKFNIKENLLNTIQNIKNSFSPHKKEIFALESAYEYRSKNTDFKQNLQKSTETKKYLEESKKIEKVEKSIEEREV